MLHDQQAENGLGWRGMAAMDGRQPIALHQIAAHLLKQAIIIEQAIELAQHRVYPGGEFGHAGKDVFGRIAIHEHGEPPQARVLLYSTSLMTINARPCLD